MATLESAFSRQDIETLIDSMSDWEMIGNQEFHLMEMMRNAPMPPEDHEAFEMMEHIKDHFKMREKDIKDSRATRQEKAVFLKAKLMMARGDMGINQLFDFATSSDKIVESKQPTTVTPSSDEPDNGVTIPVQSSEPEDLLALAEEYMKDIGIWDRFQNFVKEKKEESQK